MKEAEVWQIEIIEVLETKHIPGECTVQNRRPCGDMARRSAARLREAGGRSRSRARSSTGTERSEAGKCVYELSLIPSLSKEGKRHK